MEAFIPIIIALLFSVFFNKKKEPDKKTVEKPVNSTPSRKTVSENPFKELGDFAKQFTNERQQEKKTKPPVVREVPVVEKMEREVKRNQGVARSSGRLSTHQESAPLRPETTPVNSMLPSSEDELIRAIIFSEILAPPKSKR
ncbi:hypothetical protein SAMN05421670_0153 [Psychrobacillus psychrotolerans]|uniref:Uncharacterized protein n=1 Tax=Psychrobacillus psychrotolerans TaxID=126156 RepID=A0A1I6B532_9BACI|nr:hypothetical protein [Psychrobacillus psychrotolerans]SFQ75897.1 hypothetical protein SAMN05421670_0153 [Psychrobacillus psychrotolerans]